MTLNDIATNFKISLTTVSMCLSGSAAKYGIRRELAEAVVEYARQHGYEPNRAASRLRKNKTVPPLGIVFTYESGLAKVSTPLREIVAYLEENNRDYTMMGLKNSYIGKTMSILRSMGVRDVLVLGRLREVHPDDPENQTTKLLRADWRIAWNLLKDGMRLYASDYIFPLPPEHADANFIRVGFDTAKLESDLLKQIKEAGLGPVVISDKWTRREKQLIPDLLDSPEMILPYEGTVDRFADGLRMARLVLELRSRRPVRTVFLSNDYAAAGLLRGLLDAGVKIPEEVGVIGFGNCEAAPYFSRSLTTIGSASGSKALELLRSICGELPPFPDNTVLDYVLYERESFRFPDQQSIKPRR